MVKVSLIIDDGAIQKRHKEESLKWDDEQDKNWINDDTDTFNLEEMYFDRLDGELTITCVSDKGFFVNMRVSITEWIDAVHKSNISETISKWIDKAKEAQEAIPPPT